MRAKNSCVPKLGLSFLALYSRFHFSQEGLFWGLGGWMGPERGHLSPPHVGLAPTPPPPPLLSK